MGTNTPHTCIPGLVWQEKARRFSQFELKVGDFPFTLYVLARHYTTGGYAAAIFPLGEYGPLKFLFAIDRTVDHGPGGRWCVKF